MEYSADIVQIMIYPIAIRYLTAVIDENNVTGIKLAKSYVVFMSKDLKHDHQQIMEMENAYFNQSRNRLICKTR